MATPTRLENGEVFPTISASAVEGGEMTLPDDLDGSWALVVFYRGHWWEHCHRQLAGLEEQGPQYEAADVRVVALSADGEGGARKMVSDEDLSFPVLYGLDVDDMKERLGLYIEKGEKTHLQPAQFVLDPAGRIQFACYSSGPVGRLSAAEALGVVDSARG